MTVYEYDGKTPNVDPSSFIQDSAEIIGNVTIGENCYIAPGARIKGDYNEVRIGDRVIIEDNCVLHGNADEIVSIGDDVVLGHGSILHSCTIEDYALVGMGAVVSDGAKVGRGAIVGEGSVVPQRMKIPERKIAVGVPAKIVKNVLDGRFEAMLKSKKKYQEIYREYEMKIRKI